MAVEEPQPEVVPAAPIIQMSDPNSQPENPPSPDLSPRSIVSWWRDDYREKWGRLANELADQGFAYPTDEAEAFRRIVAEARGLSNIPSQTKRPGEPRGQLRAWMFDDSLSHSTAQVRAWLDQQ